MRLEHLGPAQLDADQADFYGFVSTRVRAAQQANPGAGVRMIDEEGRLEGPFNSLLHHPRLGRAQYDMLQRLRADSVLSARVREILILVVAGSEHSEYEWAAHSVIGRELGFTDDQIAGFAAGRRVSFTDQTEDLASEVAGALVTTGDLSDDVYERADAELGAVGLVEAVTLVAYYQLLAMQMRVFRVEAPPGPWPRSDQPSSSPDGDIS